MSDADRDTHQIVGEAHPRNEQPTARTNQQFGLRPDICLCGGERTSRRLGVDTDSGVAQYPLMKTLQTLLLALSAAQLSTLVLAQDSESATGRGKPTTATIVDTIPVTRDMAYPGIVELRVDATDVARGIFQVSETIPVKAGPLVLLYPAWLPGDHAPQGAIDKVAGLKVTAQGAPIAWRRDTVDVHAFHLIVPVGVTSINATFQFLSATSTDQGPVVMTPNILALEWISALLYPAGYYVRQIMVEPTMVVPAGWAAATALRTNDNTTKGGTIRYHPVALDTLADSPVFAGRYFSAEQLSPDVTLNVFADRADELRATPAQLAVHHALVVQAVRLFGAQHYSHYDFLLALSDRIDGFGLEHHRSSEDQAAPDYFLDWDANVANRDLLAHEFTHSWNGKFRRPADLWTPDFRAPMQNSLLWVYEGQTQFWGNVLAARSGMVSLPDSLDKLAAVAAYYSNQAGRSWRTLADTTNEEIISNRRPEPSNTWQRAEDYYSEGELIWLDVDSLIRERSHGRRSLDDFARTFFGVRDRDWGELTYTFDDVVAALNTVEPYDWAGFLRSRVDVVGGPAPLGGLARAGYNLVYSAEPGKVWSAREKSKEITDFSYSVGLITGKSGIVKDVRWGGPAFAAGISVGSMLIAINGSKYDDSSLKAVITANKGASTPITLLIQQGDQFRSVDVVWNGGLRYPHLERRAKAPGTLDQLFSPRR
jgi:predicted metalloprotease with PDZ domain